MHEFGVRMGENRVDIATVNRRSLSGYELKSDRDSLFRLPKQSEAFSSTFDKMTIVVSPLHTEAALKIVPEWWAVHEDNGLRYRVVRTGMKNPNVSASDCLLLLWKRELIELVCDAIGHQRGIQSMTKQELNALIIACVQPNSIISATRQMLWKRFSTPIAVQPTSCDDSLMPAAKNWDFQFPLYPSCQRPLAST
ncbi:MAG: sce7726 family protein [Bacteroidetes bacterium]|nr:sce7726 family protein [Bacteroidota bacterium]